MCEKIVRKVGIKIISGIIAVMGKDEGEST